MKVSEHFDLREFIDPVTFRLRGEKSIELIDARIISIAEAVRQLTDCPVTINDWHTGGHYKESGLRIFSTSTGAKFSQHKYGRAVDLKVKGMDAEDVRNLIRQNWSMFHNLGLTTIEKDTPSWVHVDCRNTGLEKLYEIPFK